MLTFVLSIFHNFLWLFKLPSKCFCAKFMSNIHLTKLSRCHLQSKLVLKKPKCIMSYSHEMQKKNANLWWRCTWSCSLCKPFKWINICLIQKLNSHNQHFLSNSACLVSSICILNFSSLKVAFEMPINILILSNRLLESEEPNVISSNSISAS